MSSSPPPEVRPVDQAVGRRWGFARWSLRAKLSAVVVALLAALCLVFGVATEVALHELLVHQTDARLQAAGVRSQDAFRGPGDKNRDGPHGAPPFLSATGQ